MASRGARFALNGIAEPAVEEVLLASDVAPTRVPAISAALRGVGATSARGIRAIPVRELRHAGLSLTDTGAVLAHAEAAEKKHREALASAPLATSILLAAVRLCGRVAWQSLAARYYRKLACWAGEVAHAREQALQGKLEGLERRMGSCSAGTTGSNGSAYPASRMVSPTLPNGGINSNASTSVVDPVHIHCSSLARAPSTSSLISGSAQRRSESAGRKTVGFRIDSERLPGLAAAGTPHPVRGGVEAHPLSPPPPPPPFTGGVAGVPEPSDYDALVLRLQHVEAQRDGLLERAFCQSEGELSRHALLRSEADELTRKAHDLAATEASLLAREADLKTKLQKSRALGGRVGGLKSSNAALQGRIDKLEAQLAEADAEAERMRQRADRQAKRHARERTEQVHVQAAPLAMHALTPTPATPARTTPLRARAAHRDPHTPLRGSSAPKRATSLTTPTSQRSRMPVGGSGTPVYRPSLGGDGGRGAANRIPAPAPQTSTPRLRPVMANARNDDGDVGRAPAPAAIYPVESHDDAADIADAADSPVLSHVEAIAQHAAAQHGDAVASVVSAVVGAVRERSESVSMAREISPLTPESGAVATTPRVRFADENALGSAAGEAEGASATPARSASRSGSASGGGGNISPARQVRDVSPPRPREAAGTAHTTTHLLLHPDAPEYCSAKRPPSVPRASAQAKAAAAATNGRNSTASSSGGGGSGGGAAAGRSRAALSLVANKIHRTYGDTDSAFKGLAPDADGAVRRQSLAAFFAALGMVHLMPPVLDAAPTVGDGKDRYELAALIRAIKEARRA